MCASSPSGGQGGVQPFSPEEFSRLRPFLALVVQAPIIVTLHAPADPAYDFKKFYEMTRDRGYILYPGKLTQVETFRVGCIGAIDANEMRNVVSAVEQTLKAMGINQVAPVTQRKAA